MRKIAKVPVVMQMEATECGAASLAMVLAYFGRWLPLEQVRLDCGVGRDGSNAGNLLKAARTYGLKAQGYRCSLDGVKKMSFPLIVHWNFNHFVVLCGFKKEQAVLCDPGRGRVTVTMKEFDEAFTGIALTFEKSEAFTPGGRPRSILVFVRSRRHSALGPFLFVAAITFLIAVAGMAAPVFSRIFMDEILSGKNAAWLTPFLAALGALFLFQTAVSLLQTVCLLKIRGKLAVSANSGFMWHVLRLPIEFFSQRYAGDIAQRQQSNEGIAETLIAHLAPMALNLAMLFFYFFVMLQYSPLLTVIGLFTAVLNLAVTQYVSGKRINLARAQMRDAGKLAATALSGIEMIETIKASGAENGFFERWSGLNASVNSAEVGFAKLGSTLGILPTLLTGLANMTVILLGAALIMKGRFTVGMLLAFQGFLSAFMSPVDALLTVGQKFQEMRTSMERVEDVMNYPADVEYDEESETETKEADGQDHKEAAKGLPSFEKLRGRLELRDITFGYSRLAPPLIRDFSLTLPPGGTVALVGSSGCGKSTLAKLMSGLYQPWGGEIRYDGKLRSEIPRMVFTGSLAVVDQDVILFEDSITENIRIWDKSIEDFEIIMAARDAQIHEDIMSREGGYGVIVRENGKNFSGGQCQRLEIARVLAQDPTIVILDEVTSALDARTEFEVIHSIRERGITCVIVAHRLSTIRDCDEIIVLEDGCVVERGTHEELYAKGGAYSRLISTE
ncbi:NHLP family bacteriocin export ABC transporter peptidase/permease/ATPase subunit [Enterocloster bolteae]|uniref:NHLP family bacteriocin export ABC transporter peptidase/permease/ATPase subunit n=1 Tax=Enterocloster bolteae TaxID=208479 RepID=UPI001D05C4F9|nr:NHLP family bacteriocin export ABC transporter peptidase/permease/ATPase subunit [Enterocloster bolteae]MCB6926129.1 NHLP family bacteriocin export ABC transporter peptidase/permease/ATPase subunit [Enterocloster bolteae]MCQ4754758.1 NHLP family bacteriocin export ABC transporter peptidase/permease/ATPase subunit [Enterocloster bolteae]